MKKLSGKRVAILVADGFEQVELMEARTALEDEGALTDIVSPSGDRVRGWKFTDWGRKMKVDVPVSVADPALYDALLLPGGVMSPDKLRLSPEAIHFVHAFVDSDKPIAAICHGPWTLINAGGVPGKRMTSWPTLEIDLRNAGADWEDSPVVRDGKLVTSRNPDDISAFNATMVDVFAERPSVVEFVETEIETM